METELVESSTLARSSRTRRKYWRKVTPITALNRRDRGVTDRTCASPLSHHAPQGQVVQVMLLDQRDSLPDRQVRLPGRGVSMGLGWLAALAFGPPGRTLS